MAIDHERLGALTERALEHPEIQPHVGNVISRGTLLRRAREAQDEIWEAAGSARMAEESLREEMVKTQAAMRAELRDNLNRHLNETQTDPALFAYAITNPVAEYRLNKQQKKTAADLRDLLPKPKSTAASSAYIGWFFLAFLVVIGSLLTLLIAYIVFVTRNGWSDGAVAFQHTGWIQITEAVLGLGVILSGVFFKLDDQAGDRSRDQSWQQASKVLDEITTRTEGNEQRLAWMQKQAESMRTAADEALFQAIVRFLRREVDAAAEDDYSTALPNIVPSGLAEGFNVRSELITSARTRLEHLLRSMPNGSIGISGPRGAGKSTLLRSFAAKENIQRTSDSGDTEQLPLFSVEVSAPVQYDAREFVLYIFSKLCVRVRKMTGDSDNPGIATSERPATPPRWEQLLVELSQTFVRICTIIAVVLLLLALVAAASLSVAGDAAKNPFARMGIKPVDVALQALVWWLAAFVLKFVARHLRRMHADKEEEARQLAEAKEPMPPMPDSFRGMPGDWENLRRKARECAILLRYQRNYASDWSVGAKFAGLEAGMKQGETWQEQRLTLPEIVAFYREFVELLARHFVVLIAIDELDKIASDEKAQQFLNDIKALFGIPSCFYLITVSDNAMSTFARRGLPIRDAFDSALDEIVRVEHMALDTAQKLLAGRVIGLPIPFLAFCYCFSAGLPRDLIRSCRDVFEHAERTGSRELKVIGHDIFREDLITKIEASITAITQAHKTAAVESTGLLDRLWRLRSEASLKTNLLDDYNDLTHLIREAKDSTSKEVRALTIDLASYLYYAMTVLEVITKQTDVRGLWEGARNMKLFEELARLRRYIGVDSLAAGTAIGILRASQQLQIPAAKE